VVLTTPSDEYVLRLWRTADGTRVELKDATGYDLLYAELAFTPDNKVLFARRKGKLAWWDTATGKRLADVPLPTDARWRPTTSGRRPTWSAAGSSTG